MKLLIKKTIYPLSYNKNLIRGTAQWAKAFNKWGMYVRGELVDDRMLVEAKRILTNLK